MEKYKINQILSEQQQLLTKDETLIDRNINLTPYLKGNEIIVITGVRRCGKSTLLKLISKKIKTKKLYINFDDIRFNSFKTSDFEHLNFDDTTYFLDEIQNVPGWERWVNNLHANGSKVFVTGSNSSLLSSEISTYLTGRNKPLHLKPFNFIEYLAYTSKQPSIDSFTDYFMIGGFPEVIKNNDLDLARQIFEDILYKDVINRFRIREVRELKDLILFTLANTGQRLSFSTLKSITSIKSLSTIKNFLSYLENVYLATPIKRFDYSVKKQIQSSSKIYYLDNSFFSFAFNFSENFGRRLENFVFNCLEGDIYYHQGRRECDFLVRKGRKICQAIQVTKKLEVNEKREIEGLKEAMRYYKLKEGLILTYDTEKKINNINILPVWKWILKMPIPKASLKMPRLPV